MSDFIVALTGEVHFGTPADVARVIRNEGRVLATTAIADLIDAWLFDGRVPVYANGPRPRIKFEEAPK